MGMGLIVGAASFLIFVLFQAQGVGAGDSGDLVTAAYSFGVPHPPGYPLYSVLGWLAGHIPLFTPAWRLGLLSSLPHAIVIGLVFHMAYRLSGRRDSALFAAVVLAGNYLFFLYSTTQEVFALLDVFLIVLLYLVIIFRETGKSKYLYVAALLFGVSLTHHHLIIFVLPVVAYWLIHSGRIQSSRVSLFRLAVLGIVGLLPYVYVPVAAQGSSPINWDRATTARNFLRLVTRDDYGTFVSGASIGQHPLQRILAVKAYAQILTFDFQILGILLFAVGIVFFPKRFGAVRSLLLLCMVVLGPVFFFYASFPLANRFTLGTYERFLLPSYVLVVLFIAVGHAKGTAFIAERIGRIVPHIGGRTILACVVLISFLYPLSSLFVTVWRFWGMPTDKTTENLAADMFAQVPQESVIALSRDTPLFIAQYARYAQGVRSDTAVVHGSFLSDAEYRKTLAGVFPFLSVPEGDNAVSEFLTANAAKRPVFANTKYPVGNDWFWIPHGLLFRLVPKDALPTVEETRRSNERLWREMHRPDDGILARYNHLMLSDVRDVYTSARMEFGKLLLRANLPKEAEQQFGEAIAAGGDTERVDAYVYRGLSLSFDNRCQEALESFDKAKLFGLSKNTQVLLFEGFTYRDCVGDPQRAQSLFSQYEHAAKDSDRPLEGW